MILPSPHTMVLKLSLAVIAAWMTLFVSEGPAEAAGVFQNVPEAAEDNYVVLYELAPPIDGGFRDGTPVPYTIDNSQAAPDFDRVAYYLDLTGPEGSEWIWVSMEAFTDDATKLGLPHNINNPVVHQRNVRNMNVASNVSGIVTGTFIDTGHIEMWPSNYSMRDSYGVFAADDDLFDWGDGGATANAGYGSFQIHNTMARQTLLAYNAWGSISGAPDDIGIGNQPEGHPDWTYAANADSYTARTLVILVRPRSHRISFDELPRDRQLFSRDLATNRAEVSISGVESFGGHDRIHLRVFRNGDLHFETEQALDYQNGSAPFVFTPTIAAELATYDFEILLETGGSFQTVERVQDVVAGDAFLFYGQSNAEARSYDPDRSANVYANPWIRTFGQSGDSGDHAQNILYWAEAEGDGTSADPAAIGQWAMVFGYHLVDDYQIPVAILNGARSGYRIDRLQKDRNNPDALHDSGSRRRPYNRLRYRAVQAGIASTVRAMFYYQGEHDSNDDEAHMAGFASLMEDWQIDYPGIEKFYVTQVRPGCGVSERRVQLRDVQRRFQDVYPNVSVMASNAIEGHDDCHYLLVGYEQLAEHHFRKVSRDLYGGPDGPDIDAINPASVHFTDETFMELRIVLRNPDATVHFPDGARKDFVIPDTDATVTSGHASGGNLYLQLSGPVPADSILEYRGFRYEGEWVTNANGVGMLSFAEPILLPPGPRVTLLSPEVSQQVDVGQPVEIDAFAEPGGTGSVVRVVLYVNGVPIHEQPGNSLTTTWSPAAAGAHRLTIRAFDGGGHYTDRQLTILAGAQTSPGGVSDGLQVWLKAEAGAILDENNRVTEWRDQSGNEHHALQLTGSARPRLVEGLYGIGPGIHFDGSSYLTSSSGMPTGDYTKVVLFTITSADPGLAHNLVSSPERGSSSARDHALFIPGLLPSLHHNGTFAQSTAPVTVLEPALVVASYETSSRGGTIYLDGVHTGTGVAPGHNTKSSYQIGAYRTPADYLLVGSIAEIMIYDRVLTAAERTAIEDYFETKYLTPFELWQRIAFGEEMDSSPTADPDGDGLPNLLEYALGLDPVFPDPARAERAPRVQVHEDLLEITYRRSASSQDVTLQLEASTDLIAWSPVPDTGLSIEDGIETRRSTLPQPATRIFFRLKATLPSL